MQVDQSAGKSGKSRSRLASFASRQVNRAQHQHQQADCHAQLVASGNSGKDSPHHHYQYCDNNNNNNQHQHHQQQQQLQLQQHSAVQTKELIRQCFLFTNHLLLCTRTKDGKLHLLEVSSLSWPR